MNKTLCIPGTDLVWKRTYVPGTRIVLYSEAGTDHGVYRLVRRSLNKKVKADRAPVRHVVSYRPMINGEYGDEYDLGEYTHRHYADARVAQHHAALQQRISA